MIVPCRTGDGSGHKLMLVATSGAISPEGAVMTSRQALMRRRGRADRSASMDEHIYGTAYPALFNDLLEVKRELQAVEFAVTNRIYDGADRALKSSGRRQFHEQWATASCGHLAAAAAMEVAANLTGSGPGFFDVYSMLTSLDVNLHVVGLAEGYAAGIMLGTLPGRKRDSTIRDQAAQRCHDFIFAGVMVELALGDLQKLFDSERGDSHVDGETLAEYSSHARQAFRHYADTMRLLEQDDVSIRFPWSAPDVDVAAARKLLVAGADSCLERVERASWTNWVAEAGSEPLTASPRAGVSSTPGGGLDAMRAAAASLQAQLKVADSTLETLVAAVTQAMRTDRTTQLTLLKTTAMEAQARGRFAAADCRAIRTAVRSAKRAATSQGVFDTLQAAPSPVSLGRTFNDYATQVEAAAWLADMAPESIHEAAAMIAKTSRNLPQLYETLGRLTTAMRAEAHRLCQPA